MIRPAMRIAAGSVVAAVLALACAGRPAAQPAAVLLTGGRVIPGDGRPPIENAAVVVQDGRIVQVDVVGRVAVPSGVQRIDVSGKTLMPAIVDGHVHLGFQVGLNFAAANYTRATLIDQLNRYAYAGVGTVLSMGTDAGDLPLQVRADQTSGKVGGARFLLAGRGLAAPNAGPASPEMKPTAFGVETEADARRLVRELVAQHVNVVKIWVDDRNHTVQKLSPALYRAVIDESHKLQTKVVAHVFYLDDAKDLARAGVDAFAHLVRDTDADDELVSLVKAHHVLVMPNMTISENGVFTSPPAWLDDPLLHDVAPSDWIERVRASFSSRSPEAAQRASQTLRMMQRTLAKLQASGAIIGFGTDDGAVRDHFYAFTAHRELRNMVAAGMTPLQAITAATQTTAAFLGFNDRGVIAPGKTADFIILNANPLDDIANTTRIADVYLRGEKLDRPSMRASFK
jgi:imidazolonepropionase-like amidohydrolase